MKLKHTSVTLSQKAKKQIEEIKAALSADGSREKNNNDVIEMGIDELHRKTVRGGGDEH